jgi:hypothetical protein
MDFSAISFTKYQVPLMKELLKNYVIQNQDVCSSQWDPNISAKLLFDPYLADEKLVSHYFLLVASITETLLIGRAENARDLIIRLHKALGDDLFSKTRPMYFNELIENSPFIQDFGPEYRRIGSILAAVNKWVLDTAEGDLVKYSSDFSGDEFALELQNIPRMNNIYSEKVWMYLRWSTRPRPDLGLFHFNVENLKIPLTSQVIRVGTCLGLFESAESTKWNEIEYRDWARDRITNYALQLFPNDPLTVDFPFYMLGRWMEDITPSEEELRNYIVFFDDLYKLTGTAASTYDIVSREKSGFETNLRRLLENHKLMFIFEAQKFNLGNGLTYRPDFILPNIRIDSKKVILEPHGIWKGKHVDQVTSKYKLFKELFGHFYYFIRMCLALVPFLG